MQFVDKSFIWANWVGCRPPGGNVRHENYMAALNRPAAQPPALWSAIADATDWKSVDYLGHLISNVSTDRDCADVAKSKATCFVVTFIRRDWNLPL